MKFENFLSCVFTLFLLVSEPAEVNACSPSTASVADNYQRQMGLPPATAYNDTSGSYSNLRHYGQDCGFSKYWKADGIDFSSIVGGTEAYPNEFPYQAKILLGGRFICGGSIIHE